MIEEPAIVVSSGGGYAEVDANRRSSCGGCSSQSGCGTSVLAGVFGNKPTRVKALNKIGAKPGDRVILAIPENDLLYSAFTLYGLPLAGFLGGAIAGRLLSQLAGWPASQELGSIVAGLAGLWAGLVQARRLSHRRQRHARHQAEIVRFQHQVTATIEQLR